MIIIATNVKSRGISELSVDRRGAAEIGHHKEDRWFDGRLDEYYIFERALPQEEISEVMNRALLAVEPEDKLTTTWGDIKFYW